MPNPHRTPLRQVSNLSWPTAPYSTAHRPVQQPIRLLTGLAVTATGWAAVHVPVHRTKPKDAAATRLGVHAVPVDGIAAIEVLDQLLLAARRQAVAVAGHGLRVPVAWFVDRLQAAGLPSPGLTSLLREWPLDNSDVAPAKAGKAQLLELTDAALPPAAAALLQQAPVPLRPLKAWDSQLAQLTLQAAAIALAAAALSGRATLPDGFAGPQLRALLDAEAGDLLPFTEIDLR